MDSQMRVVFRLSLSLSLSLSVLRRAATFCAWGWVNWIELRHTTTRHALPTRMSSHEIKVTSSPDRTRAVQRRGDGADVDLGCFQVLQQRLGIIKQGGVLILMNICYRSCSRLL